MKHYGDITKISGYDVPIVDVVTGGSPCQDLSVAGKRAGLAGERSGLFMEQMRIVREMREKDARDSGRTGWAVRPRYMVWENVPGAFSSGNPKGSDFAAVIEEIIKVAEPNSCVRVCVPDGGWTKAGCYYSADGKWSIAWRLHDAQFWGVPQRRKRIALVADFGGLSAPEILFERKGLRGDTEPSGAAGESSAAGVERSPFAAMR
jgi:DNA (cytosine-5)-methyltransferase 1